MNEQLKVDTALGLLKLGQLPPQTAMSNCVNISKQDYM